MSHLPGWSQNRRIAAIGEPLLELSFGKEGEIGLAYGGDVANTMVCLARILPRPAAELYLVTALGSSSYSQWLRGRLEQEDIHLLEPAVVGEPGIYGIPLEADRQQGFSYWRSQSAARAFLQTLDAVALERMLTGVELLLVTGITLGLCSDSSFSALCDWASRNRNRCRIVFDCNFRPALWPGIEVARARISTFEKCATVVVTGMEDERRLWGAQDLTGALRRLEPLAVEFVIRDGPRGCWIGAGNVTTHVPATPARVLDTVGAGDAHLAGYVAARIAGCLPVRAAEYAGVVAGVVVAQRGAAAVPSAPLPALDEFIRAGS